MSPTRSESRPTVSVIVPCWNDAEALQAWLREVSQLHGLEEIIVADASTTAECAKVARSHGAHVVNCPEPNRGSQMNAGAQAARGEILLFKLGVSPQRLHGWYYRQRAIATRAS